FFLHLFDAAELHSHAPSSFIASHARLYVSLNLAFGMELQLVFHFGFHRVPSQEGTQSKEQIVEHERLLSRAQNLRNSGRQPLPRILFGGKLLASSLGEFVEFRAAVVVGHTPAGFDPPSALQTMKGG